MPRHNLFQRQPRAGPMLLSKAPTIRRSLTRPKGSGFDHLFRYAAFASACTVLVVLAGILGAMVYGAIPAFREFGPGFLTGASWNVPKEQYGALSAIIGTLASSGIALIIGVPVSLGIAIFLTQLCPAWLKRPVSTIIELLAAVPSIIYGMWGLFVFAPLFAQYVEIPLSELVDGIPLVGTLLYASVPSGQGVMTAGIILAIMIIPLISSTAREILDQLPVLLRESAYGMGCTTYEVVRHVLMPQAAISLIGAMMLGLGRALGETMAVTFVIGNSNRLTGSILDPGSTIASRIANAFDEAQGMQLNALLALGCILFLVTFVVLILARLLVARVKNY